MWTNSVTNGVSFIPTIGTTTYQLTGTDANGCENVDEVSVTVHSLPTVNFTISQDTTCVEAGGVALTASPSGGTFSGTGVTGATFDPSASGEGQFSIEYAYTDANGCSDMESQTIVVEDCSSLLENELTDVSVYPNPTMVNSPLRWKESSRLRCTTPVDELYLSEKDWTQQK